MGATEVVKAVNFRFMLDEEVKSHSVVKITNPNLVDILGRPIPGGLYDLAMGPHDKLTPCISCGLKLCYCHGHWGHIDLVLPAYNPLLVSTLYDLLNKICFFCYQFRASRGEVENYVSQLRLIERGDILAAKMMRQQKFQSKKTVVRALEDLEDSEGSHTSHSTVLSDGENDHDHYNKQAFWDSCLLTEAMSVLNEFVKKKERKCMNCGCKNPKIIKPTFGWFCMSGLSSADIRANAIRSGEHTSNNFSGPLLPSEVKDILRRVWESEAPLTSYISNIQQHKSNIAGHITSCSMFFLETILVMPTKFRPLKEVGDSVVEHQHTILLGKVLQSNITLGNAHTNSSERSRIISRWLDLQQSINVLFDSNTATSQSQRDGSSGICQFLEKKEGIFRQNMMGKRVNFSCRSVISPDPYLSVNEIGIPQSFALRLTYPEGVTPWNAGKLRDAVINGPKIHPGATNFVDGRMNNIGLSPDQKMVRTIISREVGASRGIDAVSGKINNLELGSEIVYRHLKDGDIVLVNRQPTLHKPSIMAHVVRVLKGEKTIRMHYANCSSYNADFDGDEINVHFPQDEISRAEAYSFVNANEQYIVPTRGDTVRGLIQDHIVSAVLLTMKDTFLTQIDFNQLLYGSGVFAVESGSLSCNHSRKVCLVDSEGVVESILPTVWKPVPLWTGKQVITALLNHITRGCAPCTVKNHGKIPKSYFTGDSFNNEEYEDHNAEHELLIWKNELVRGVIDKSQFGKFGLVHTVQELYGSNSAGILLSALSRLFTIFLQIHGFTCGVDDLTILPNYDIERKEKLEGEDVGEDVHCEFVKFKPGEIGPEELRMEIEKVISSDRESATATLDMKMKNKLTSRLTKEGSQILKHLLTIGLLKPFPKNCVSLMTTTGAKGSTVNFQQISAYLGQQELEGKRVPRMVSGKTLPCFPPWDFTSRAGGFIIDRFLTGLRPQEYYFHCMAGREGLVDTAVKTSRSGYLQRCLIKNLESLKVCYDYTVRDSDGSIVQFYYGEDGVDVHHTSFLTNFKALEDNREIICQKFQNKHQFNSYISKLPEGLEEESRRFVQLTLDNSLERQNTHAVKHLHKRKWKGRKKEDKAFPKEQEELLELVKQKYLRSLAQPGEAVGIIAAQSIGEPSTQMTLNTFHLAGRGEINVTLGIPRLQEILMTASDVIKTPILTCPFSEWRSRYDLLHLVSNVKKVTLADLVENMEVRLSIECHKVARIYKLTIKLRDTGFFPLEDIQDTLKTVFVRELEDAIENHVIFLLKVNGIKNIMSSSRLEASNEAGGDDSGGRTQEANDDDDDSDDNDKGDDLGSDVPKRKLQVSDEIDYGDGSDADHGEEYLTGEWEKGNSDRDHHEATENSKDEETEHSEDKDKTLCNDQNVDEVMSEGKSSRKKVGRAVYMEVKGLSFKIHFRFTSEPHLLLAQIAQKTLKKVCITKRGRISNCRMVQYDPDEKTVLWDDKRKPKKGQTNSEEAMYCALKASGIDFKTFWEMQDDLDVNRLYSNNINSMLKTYGVEAARASLIREVKQVFDIYGVKIDYRHLSLVADYMTQTGGYRAMSRHGCMSDAVSPFLKMSFEVATKFMVEAASHQLTDDLETPTSRILLGLPVKMGTGCFDLLQKLDS